MHAVTSILATSLLTAVASAQYVINPNSVPLSTRQYWCQQQTTECPLICLQYPGNTAATQSNTCDATALAYSCVCSSGLTPNASEFTQTLPYFVCTEWGNQCVSGCGSDSSCASDCRSQHPCAAKDPRQANSSLLTATTSSATSTGAGGAATTDSNGQTVYTGFGGAAATSSTDSGSGSSGAASLYVGQTFGLWFIAAGVIGGFAVLL